ncbi:MAG: glycosyltransferase family 25 protein [Anaerovoracaceae bacterium]
MKIYLISLEKDTERRAELAQCFPQNYPKMQWVKAINGKELSAKEYFSYAQQFFNSHQKMITPSEVGCTLSHIRALEEFLETEEECCLILEDDVIGGDESIEKIDKFISENNLDGVVLLRDQNKFGFEKYIIGKEHKCYYKLPFFSTRFVYGTCAYIVNRKSAQLILNYHQQNFDIADIWSNIVKETFLKFYYFPVLIHPEDCTHSHIENERAVFYMDENSFFKRIYKQGAFWKIYNRIRNDTYRCLLMLKGYKQIHKDKPQ